MTDNTLQVVGTGFWSIDSSLQKVASTLERIDGRLGATVDQIGAFVEGLARMENLEAVTAHRC